MSVYDKDLPKSAAGIYHKFEDGVTYILRLISEPIVVVSEYKGTENTKYAWLAYNIEENVPQIVRLPVTAARKIWDLARDEEYGDPTTYNIKITRTGKDFDTQYAVLASPKKAELDPEAVEACSKIDPIEMINKGKGIVDVYYLSEAEDGEVKPRSESQPAPVEQDQRDDLDEPW